MFCKTCGSHLENGETRCSDCGAEAGTGSSFCARCGAMMKSGASRCDQCGASANYGVPHRGGSGWRTIFRSESGRQSERQTGQREGAPKPYQDPGAEDSYRPPRPRDPYTPPLTRQDGPDPVVDAPYEEDGWAPQGKSKLTAAVLALFLGSFGLHNLYLGEYKKAALRFLTSGMGIGFLLAIFDLVKMALGIYRVDPDSWL